jgi:DNA anti-recombination protein RmuC
MDVEQVAPALQQRLGTEATVGLLALLDVAKQEWAADVITAAVDRFERRLTTESAGLRVSMTEQGAQLRREMAEQGAQLRQEMAAQGAQLRQEMAEQIGKLRQEMIEQNGRLRVDMAELGARVEKDNAESRFALLKWSFAFWIGQVVAMAAVMAVMLRLTGH